MNQESDVAELQAISDINIFEGMLEYLLLEGIGLIFIIIAFVLIIASSIKLIRKSNIPGSRLIFISIILTIIGTVLSAIIEYYFIDENIYIYDAALNMYLGAAFFLGSYGFFKVCNHVTN